MASTRRSRAQAESGARRREVLFRQAAREAQAQTRRIRTALLRDFRAHGNAAAMVDAAAAGLGPQIARLMTVMDLQARVVAMRMARKLPDPISFDRAATPYEQAVHRLANQLELSKADLALLQRQYDTASLKTVQQFTAGLRSKLGQVSAEVLARGVPTRSAVGMIREAMSGMGLSPESPRLVETVYRTQGAVAYTAGRWQANQEDAIASILWGYEYVTVGDDRVRPSHRALDGTRLPKEDPRWQSIMPPNGWNCRCDVIEIFQDDHLATPAPPPEGLVVIDGVETTAQPDEGWSFNPGAVFGFEPVETL